jgi:prevent-host-death family protein
MTAGATFGCDMDQWLLNGYIRSMGSHSVAEAKNNLSKLIKRALGGEPVVITRHGQPVVELTPVKQPWGPGGRRITKADIEWLERHRVTPLKVTEDAGTLVSRMRDEDDKRLS